MYYYLDDPAHATPSPIYSSAVYSPRPTVHALCRVSHTLVFTGLHATMTSECEASMHFSSLSCHRQFRSHHGIPMHGAVCRCSVWPAIALHRAEERFPAKGCFHMHPPAQGSSNCQPSQAERAAMTPCPALLCPVAACGRSMHVALLPSPCQRYRIGPCQCCTGWRCLPD